MGHKHGKPYRLDTIQSQVNRLRRAEPPYIDLMSAKTSRTLKGFREVLDRPQIRGQLYATELKLIDCLIATVVSKSNSMPKAEML